MKKIKCDICDQQTNAMSWYIFYNYHLKTVHNLEIEEKDYYDMYYKKEDEGICLTCGKETKFLGMNKGYNKFCSNYCVGTNKDVQKLKEQKSLEKYGTKNVSQSDEIKNKINEVVKSKYGVNNVFELEEMQQWAREVKKEKYGNEYFNNHEKAVKTNLKKYGVENPLQNDEILNKMKKTNTERYGGNCCMCSEKYKQNMVDKKGEENRKRYTQYIEENDLKLEFIDHISYSEHNIFKCLECGEEFMIDNQLFRLRLKNKHRICTNCNDPKESQKSYSEKEIEEFLKENYNKNVILNSREIIKPNELDLYLPEEKLAIEFNGVYWHSEVYRDKNFHLNKTNICEQNQIHLIHIYEDDWKYKRDIVKSRLLNLLGKSSKIFARKCELKEISNKEVKDFLELNHLQGYCVSKINLGLFFKNELVSLMTFGGLRKNLGSKNQEGKYELLRFVNKLNFTVVGGAEKLFKYFLDKYKPLEVISYADRSWTMKNGNSLYEKLGFKFEKETQPNYSYVVNLIRENRFKYRKDVLVKEGFDSNKSEHEIMLEREIYRIYDSGQLKFVYNNKK